MDGTTGSMMHHMDGHHSMTEDLFDASTATHVAVSSGAWSDPGTWQGGRIPDDDATVHIPMGVSVQYDVVSDARLEVVRVDGALDFATSVDTHMLVESVYTGPMSQLTIGTAAKPVEFGVSAKMVFADGEIDLATDPDQLGHGLVAEGRVEIHGWEKDPYSTLQNDVSAGTKTLVLNADTAGWVAGDTIVVMGTKLGAFQDEYREIVSVTKTASGVVVELDKALDHDHTTPDGHDLSIYVGNSTRNVLLTSENPEGVRGHVMMMHTPDVSVQFAEFADLGRTDKSKLLDVDGNVAGRYPLHLHETGTDAGTSLSVLLGNSVHGSPGWGIVQHSSAAAVDYNFVHNIDGAGIVSEDGDEIGQWIGNFVTNIPGAGSKFSIERDELNADFGHSGVAYENQARQIIQQDNIAANANTGWMYRGAEVSVDNPDRDAIHFDPAPLKPVLDNEEPAIIGFHNNSAIAVDTVVDTGHRQAVSITTDLRSDMIGMVAWEVDRVFDIFSYTGEYVIRDGLFIGAEGGAGRAIKMPHKHESTSVINTHFEGFRIAISDAGLNNDGVYIGNTFKDVGKQLDASLYGTGRLQDFSDIELMDKPTLKIDGSSDLTMGVRDNEVYISGTITDSAGTLKLGSNRWTTTSTADHDGIDTTTNLNGKPEPEELIAMHGAMRDGSGGWIMPVALWITDRVTGEHHPFRIDIKLVGYTDAYLEQFEIDSFSLPSNEIVVQDSYAVTHSGDMTTDGGHGHDHGTGGTDGHTDDTGGTDGHDHDTGGTGGHTDDTGGTGGHTDDTGGTGEPTGGTGKALELTKTGVTIPKVTLSGDFTVEAWINLAENKNINRADAIVGGDKFDVNFHDGSLTVSHGKHDIVSSPVKSVDGIWTHYAVVREDGVVTLYLDGKEVSKTTEDWNETVSIDTLGDGQSLSRGLVGSIDDLRVWDVALSEGQLAGSSADTSNPDILAAYNFEDGKDWGGGTQLVDSRIAAEDSPAPAEEDTTPPPVEDTTPPVDESPTPPPVVDEPAPTDTDAHLELGKVTTPRLEDNEWISVSFSEAIENAVVIVGPVSDAGDDPAMARVRNVTDTGFELRIDEWDYLDGRHTSETVSWMAMSEGEYTLADGRQISAKSVETNSKGAVSVNMDGLHSTAPTFMQIGSDNTDGALVVRSTPTNNDTVRVQLQGEEAGGTEVEAETVFVVSIEEGTGSEFDFSSGVSRDVSDQSSAIDFGASFADTAFIGYISSVKGRDPVALRLDELGTGSASVFVEEETSKDVETLHLPEYVSWIAGEVGIFELY